MVGIETADLLSQQGKRCTVIEALSSVAPGMARNNRMELLDRLKLRGVRLMLDSNVIAVAAGRTAWTSKRRRAQRNVSRSALCLVIATGPHPS